MKHLISIAALALTAVASAQAADVGVSVNIGVPGAYGRIDIGGYPQPQLLYAQPVYIEREPSRAPPPPIYLHVPPGHAKKWNKHCREYNACGQPVYFVQDNWYRDVYAPRYEEIQRRGPGWRGDDRRDGRRDDHRGDDRRGDDRGPRGRDDHDDHDNGNGRGRGNH